MTRDATPGAELPPAPGSPEAVRRGCVCPRIDNGHGKGSGRFGADGEPLYWMSANCPVHDPTPRRETR